MKINFFKATIIPALVFSFFPFTSILFFTNSDLQPYALIFCILIFLWHFLQKNSQLTALATKIPSLVFFTLFLYSVAISQASGQMSVRGLGGYFALYIFFLLGCLANLHSSISLRLMFYVTSIWTLVGSIQLFIKHDFALELARAARTTVGRGVMSLAPEPSFYAFQCVFIWIMVDLLALQSEKINHKMVKAIKILLAFQIVILAKSFLGLALLILYLSCLFFTLSLRKQILKLLFSAFVLFLGLGFYFGAYMATSKIRFIHLVGMVFKRPNYLFISDESGGERFADIFFSVYSFFEDFPLAIGHGTMGWSEYLRNHASSFKFTPFVNLNSSRVMSALGGAIYELGWVAFLLPLVVFGIFVLKKNPSRAGTAIGLFLVIALWSAIPLATPLLGIILGVAYSKPFVRN